jgi:dTDP-4-amino-4,6-dideoxygalactose transaminase
MGNVGSLAKGNQAYVEGRVMLTAISRYGARVVPVTEQTIAACRRRGDLVQGPQIAEFEEAFVRRLGRGCAVSASYGRMAFYYILRALQLPEGSEVVIPALTFWVIPEIARVAGLKVVFADVNPDTFTLDPSAFERAVTGNTRAVVPTHLYGLPCDMGEILRVADRHNIVVIEDCAHSLGATYRGRQTGTFGAAALFSFQTLKPLNTYGGGMAVVQDRALADRVDALARAEPWPEETRVLMRLRLGRVERNAIRPGVFTLSLFPILWAASWFGAHPDAWLWESIRPLRPLPVSYRERFPNVKACLGLVGLAHLDEWTATTQAHAEALSERLHDVFGVRPPRVPPDRTHAYYQYCLYVHDRDELVRRCIRRGVDTETLHVDLCHRMDLFRESKCDAPGADRAAEAIQLPVYESLSEKQVRRVAHVLRDNLLSAARQTHTAAARVSR